MRARRAATRVHAAARGHARRPTRMATGARSATTCTWRRRGSARSSRSPATPAIVAHARRRAAAASPIDAGRASARCCSPARSPSTASSASSARSLSALRASRAPAREARRAGQMSAGLAHELNNPAAAALRSGGALGDALDVMSGVVGGFVESGVERAEAARARGAAARGAAPRADAATPRDALAAADAEDAMLDAARAPRRAGRLAARRAARRGRPRRGVARGGRPPRRLRARRSRSPGSRLAHRPHARRRAAREHGAHVDARQGDQGLLLHGPGVPAGGRRPRRPRGDAHRSSTTSSSTRRSRSRRELRPGAPAHLRLRLRAQPGLDEPARQRDRRARGPGTIKIATAPWERRRRRGARSPTTARASRRTSQRRIFEPFYTTKPVGRGHRARPRHGAPDRRRPPRRARSPWSRAPGRRCSPCGCPGRRASG